MAGSPELCTAHPARKAGWTCAACPRSLCPACASTRRAGTGSVVACRHCGSLARTILVPRVRGSFLSLVPGAFAYPFSASGLMLLAGAGVVFSLVERGGCLASLLVSGFVYALMFQIIRSTALGDEDLPLGGESDPWAALSALLKGAAAVLVALLPAIFYMALRYETGTLIEAEASFATLGLDPILYLTLALGALWGTAAIVFAATHSPFLTIVNPLSAYRMTSVAGFDFLAATVLFWVLLGAEQFVRGISGGFEEMVPVPIVARAFARAMTLYLPFVSARMLGLFLLVRGPSLGYGLAEDAMLPALGDTPPEPDVAPARASAPVTQVEPVTELTLPPEVPAPPAYAPPPEPLELDVADETMRIDDFQPIAATVADPAGFGGAFDPPLPDLDLPPLPQPGAPAPEPWGEIDASWPEPSAAPTEVLSEDELARALAKSDEPQTS